MGGEGRVSPSVQAYSRDDRPSHQLLGTHSPSPEGKTCEKTSRVPLVAFEKGEGERDSNPRLHKPEHPGGLPLHHLPLVGYEATNIYKVWIPHLDRVVSSRDVQIDEKVMYDPSLIQIPQETSHSVTILINEVDLDEDDIDYMSNPKPVTNQLDTTPTNQLDTTPTDLDNMQADLDTTPANLDTSPTTLDTSPEHSMGNSPGQQMHTSPAHQLGNTPVSTLGTTPVSDLNTGRVHSDAQPTHDKPSGRYLLTPETTPERGTEGRQEAQRPLQPPSLQQPLNPAAMPTSSPRGERSIQQQTGSRASRMTDASVLQNLRTTSGRTIRLSQRGQQAIDTSRSNRVVKTHKQARRQAHALRLQRAEMGQQIAHAFALAKSLRMHHRHLKPPPSFWHQLKHHPESEGFKQAATLEIASLDSRNTFELVDPPEGVQVLPLKWVFTYKLDEEGFLLRHKARICVRGDLQHNTGEDIYAATGAYRSFRILMALVAAFDLVCHQIDFKNAFINALMDEEVYTTCPPGFSNSGKVWRLLRALYGLRRSPRLWYQELVTYLKGLGFEPCPEEPCILINTETKVIVFIYVDDVLIMAKPEHLQRIEAFKATVRQKYEITDMGEAISFLNIRILRDLKAKKLWICQDGYIDKLAARFGVDATAMKVATPLASSYHPQPFHGQATTSHIAEMQEKVGSILYPALVSRPDVSFAASQLAQHATNPSPDHLRQANRVLSYLLTTKYLAIEFSAPAEVEASNDEILELSSDASFADDLQTRKSTQGMLMRMFGGPIMWQSSKQKTVTTSTTEAELLSLSHTARETIALYRLFKQVQFDPEHQPPILCDNLQTVGLIQKERPQATSKLRHVDIHNLWLRQIHQEGKIQVQWVPTADMPADGLTKPLTAQKHSHFIQQLGLVDITAMIHPGNEGDDDMDYSSLQISSDTE